MKRIISILGIILALTAFAGMAIGSGDSGSSSSSKYSDEYNNNAHYRDNVNDTAGVYGKDPADVDRAYNAVANAMR